MQLAQLDFPHLPRRSEDVLVQYGDLTSLGVCMLPLVMIVDLKAMPVGLLEQVQFFRSPRFLPFLVDLVLDIEVVLGSGRLTLRHTTLTLDLQLMLLC
jgi:hypothetical protein